MKVEILPGKRSVTEHHPCFNDNAHDSVGRIHLPVAPRCNIRCNYCEHRMCSNIHHPGWAARLLSVTEAVELIDSIVSERQAYDFVVGIAGPGDALANTQSLEALKVIHQHHPQITTCLCTNGLLLEESLETMAAVGVRTFTVTVNAADSRVGQQVYSWVKYRGRIYRGEEAANLLITRQFRGIEKAIATGFTLKVNTVLIPGVNDEHIPELAQQLRDIGLELMNIIPLIPAGRMSTLPAPTCDLLYETRHACEKIIPQFHRCEQCRADVMFLPEKDTAYVGTHSGINQMGAFKPFS